MSDTTTPIPCTLIRGDGIGPEIVDATLQVLDALKAPFAWQEHPAGLEAIKKCGDPLPQETLEAMRTTGLALKAPLTTPVGGGFRSVNVRLREELKLFANVRPGLSMLPDWKFQDVDIVLIRENTGGFYVGVEHFIPVGDDPRAVAEASGFMTREGCRRLARFAFEYTLAANRRKITVVHKANILKMLTGLFLEAVQEVGREYEGRVVLEDRIVDACAMQLVLNPSQFDVMLTPNMFGDILSDEIAGIIGGLGLAPGGNIGERAAMFEAVHGSAPDIAGQGKANPTAIMLAAAMMMEHCSLHAMAKRLRAAIHLTLQDKRTRTGDLGGPLNTAGFAQAVVANLA
jgi:isocitrate dehydrogenase (NAD+)